MSKQAKQPVSKITKSRVSESKIRKRGRINESKEEKRYSILFYNDILEIAVVANIPDVYDVDEFKGGQKWSGAKNVNGKDIKGFKSDIISDIKAPYISFKKAEKLGLPSKLNGQKFVIFFDDEDTVISFQGDNYTCEEFMNYFDSNVDLAAHLIEPHSLLGEEGLYFDYDGDEYDEEIDIIAEIMKELRCSAKCAKIIDRWYGNEGTTNWEIMQLIEDGGFRSDVIELLDAASYPPDAKIVSQELGFDYDDEDDDEDY